MLNFKKKLWIVKQVEQDKISITDIAKTQKISRWYVYRLFDSYKERGIDALNDKPRGRKIDEIPNKIQDDILNLVGGEFFFRKGGAGEDITEGKRTLMVIHSIKNASSGDAKRLIEILEMHTLDQKLRNEAIEIMKKYDSIDYAKEFARKILKEAWKEVDTTFPQSEAKEKIKAFADYLVERDV